MRERDEWGFNRFCQPTRRQQNTERAKPNESHEFRVSRDKSSLIAALGLINRHANTGKQAQTRIDQLNAFPATRAPKASKCEDTPLPAWEEPRDRRASWKTLKEDARRSNRRGRRP